MIKSQISQLGFKNSMEKHHRQVGQKYRNFFESHFQKKKQDWAEKKGEQYIPIVDSKSQRTWKLEKEIRGKWEEKHFVSVSHIFLTLFSHNTKLS